MFQTTTSCLHNNVILVQLDLLNRDAYKQGLEVVKRVGSFDTSRQSGKRRNLIGCWKLFTEKYRKINNINRSTLADAVRGEGSRRRSNKGSMDRECDSEPIDEKQNL